ncbi:MAG: inositol 2-dehydrogenase [Spirochaetales bacterium]|nr:inositol 2-dehydrogenase [Spirochaetales bacterium]
MADKIRVGIIGAGRIGKVHAESIAYHIPEAEVVTVSDPFVNADIEKFMKNLGVKKVTKDYKEIINDKDIDVVLICSPTNTHSQYSIEAANAGKHIFCEKPIDMDIDKIKETIKAVEKAGVKFQVGFNRRFDHNFLKVKGLVKEGKVGDIHVVRITSRDPAAPPAEYVKGSGGMFMDMTIHDFDMARYLSGSEVEEVFAYGTVLVDPAIGAAGDIDTAVVTLKFANGALGIIENSRQAVYGYDQRVEVFGNKGAVEVSNDRQSSAVLSTKEGVASEKPLYFFLERYMESFTEEKKQFFAAIKNNTAPPVGALDGLKPVLIAKAALKSVKEGRPVKISEIDK